MESIPLVIISWNNLTFIKSFLNQIKKFNHPIIILDNNSTYEPLVLYYKELKDPNIKVIRLDKNYGHRVYQEMGHLLPEVYVLSDPDLLLNENMPTDTIEQLYKISQKYNASRVGLALDISDADKFIKGNYGQLVYRIESNYYRSLVKDSEYKLYRAPIDTTFCLINKNVKTDFQLRVGGCFTAKHLPWYDGYLKNNIPKDELKVWIENNKSSSILEYINKNELIS
jgi:GT2 family glycosyltransferase